jgi:hypothetical protein
MDAGADLVATVLLKRRDLLKVLCMIIIDRAGTEETTAGRG